MTHYHLTPVSSNRKTGPLAVTTTSQDTCPNDCPLKGGDCYAGGKDDPVKAGAGPLALHWVKVTRGERGTGLEDHCKALRALPPGRMLRLNQAGDLPGDGELIHYDDAMALCTAAGHRRIAWGYTHYVRTVRNLSVVSGINNYTGTCINASADSLEQAASLHDVGHPTTVVLKDVPKERSFSYASVRFVVCPVDSGKTASCASCGAGEPLCAKKRRDYVIAFLPKGKLKRASK